MDQREMSNADLGEATDENNTENGEAVVVETTALEDQNSENEPRLEETTIRPAVPCSIRKTVTKTASISAGVGSFLTGGYQQSWSTETTMPCDVNNADLIEADAKLLVFDETRWTTAFAEELVGNTTRLEEMKKMWLVLLDRIRGCVQRNPRFRRERLTVTANPGASDRFAYAKALFHASEGFDDKPTQSEYLSELGIAMGALVMPEEQMIERVERIALKPFQTFILSTYSALKSQFRRLEKTRDNYDRARLLNKSKMERFKQQLIGDANAFQSSSARKDQGKSIRSYNGN